MTVSQFRPTFHVPTDLSPSAVLEQIRTEVAERSSELNGQFIDQHAVISFAESNRHFWSPWLHLEVRQHESKNEVFGRFSPHPSIWTAFMFAYLSLGLLAFFSVVFGLSQTLAAQTPVGYYVLPVWILLALTLWIVSQVGQNLAKAEMQAMQRLVETCLAKR